MKTGLIISASLDLIESITHSTERDTRELIDVLKTLINVLPTSRIREDLSNQCFDLEFSSN